VALLGAGDHPDDLTSSEVVLVPTDGDKASDPTKVGPPILPLMGSTEDNGNLDSVGQNLLPDFEIETGFLVIHHVLGIWRRSPAGRGWDVIGNIAINDGGKRREVDELLSPRSGILKTGRLRAAVDSNGTSALF
jgi:hypothetical protein